MMLWFDGKIQVSRTELSKNSVKAHDNVKILSLKSKCSKKSVKLRDDVIWRDFRDFLVPMWLSWHLQSWKVLLSILEFNQCRRCRMWILWDLWTQMCLTQKAILKTKVYVCQLFSPMDSGHVLKWDLHWQYSELPRFTYCTITKLNPMRGPQDFAQRNRVGLGIF